MSAAAFRSAALFSWTRNRWAFVFCGLSYALIFIGSCVPDFFERSRQFWALAIGILLFAPLVLPLWTFVGASIGTQSDLTGPEGLFPRRFFILPASVRQLVLPFMVYAALCGAVQWSLAVGISHGRLLGPTVGRLWLPFLATSFVAWMQALMWTPVRSRWVRWMQLLPVLSLYISALVGALIGTFSAELIIVLSLAQYPIAYSVAFHGVSRCRQGEPGPRAGEDRSHCADIRAVLGMRGMPQLASPLAAQLWIERRLHPWAGKAVFVALTPAVLLMTLLIAMLSATGRSDPETLGALGEVTIGLLLCGLGVIGISTGLNFAAFRSSTQSHQANAFLMPPYFAALPFAAGDFAWAKIRAATQRMLWASLGVVLTCALVAKVSGLSGAWMVHHAAWRTEYGLPTSLALAALPYAAFVMFVLSATASAVWLTLLGRTNITRAVMLILMTLTFLMLALGNMLRFNGSLTGIVAVIAAVAAVAKLSALATLILYVGSRRALTWGRLAAITGFWAATVGSLAICSSWYVPERLVSQLTGLCVAVVLAPVLGAIAAPVALTLNRVR